MFRFKLSFALACLAAWAARAEVKLPALLADHMVIQRGLPVHIWGRAEPAEAVSVTFRGETRTTAADANGVWEVYLSPGDAGGPFELSIQGRNRIVLKDVLAGDVWIAAGQSNIEWPMKWAAQPEAEIAAARHPRLRLYHAMHRLSEYAFDDLYGKSWAECSPRSVADFSAVGYHFGRYLQASVGVPVGLIQIAWGGTPVDAWTRLGAITADAALMPSLAEWARRMEEHPAALLRYHGECKEWEVAAAQAKAAGQPLPPNPVRPVGPEGPSKPGAIYNAMVAPATRFPIRGVIWYQGEANTAPERAPIYGRLFRTMIQDWRGAWGQGNFPFMFVQLASFTAVPESQWPEVREAQRRTLELLNTAMVVTIDIGEANNIHPKNKREVGRRLSLAARALVYGEKIAWSGPLFRQATREGASLRLWFNHASGGLVAPGGPLRGFEIAGQDRKFTPAEAHIEGATVVLSSPGVAAPEQVRYGWADNPDCNLYNAEQLPASPFQAHL